MILLSWNIQYGFGADGRYDLGRVAPQIARSDIACLQEVDRHWSRTGQQDQPALLQQMLPDRFMAYGPAYDMDAATPADRSRRRQFGPMVISRWPILWTRLHLLPLWPMINPINTQTGALEACIAAPTGPLRIISLHLAHVGVAERLAQIAQLQTALSPPAGLTGPWSGTDDEPDRNWTEGQPAPPCPPGAIWAGDFNMEPGSTEYRALLGEAPYHPGARYAGGLVDPAAGLGLHTHEKVIAGVRRLRQLDHILLPAALASRVRRVWTEGCDASDHLPIRVGLDLQPGG